LSLPKLTSDGPKVQVLTLEIGSDVVMRVPNEVPVERVAALVRAVRGSS
jgi:transposase